MRVNILLLFLLSNTASPSLAARLILEHGFSIYRENDCACNSYLIDTTLSKMVVDYIIEKIPLAARPADIPKRFPRLPQLYLEFFENKSKVKADLVNKEYTPPELSDDEQATTPPDLQQVSEPVYKDFSDESNDSNEELTDDEETRSVASSVQSSRKSNISARSNKQKLLNIIGKGKIDPLESKERTPSLRKIATPRVDRKLPTLKELEQQNVVKRDKVIVDAERIKDDNEDKKRDLMLKFDLLRRTYPRAHVPKVSIHEDYIALERQYEDTLHNLSIDNSVDNYKQYMTFLFMGIEWFLGKILKMDMKGYTDHQLEQMHRYEKFLVQIGEKNYIPTKKSWPVEIQLLFAVLIQTAVFVLMRSVFKGTGASILKTVNEARVPDPLGSMNGATFAPPQVSKKPETRKMRGPSINLDELPEL